MNQLLKRWQHQAGLMKLAQSRVYPAQQEYRKARSDAKTAKARRERERRKQFTRRNVCGTRHQRNRAAWEAEKAAGFNHTDAITMIADRIANQHGLETNAARWIVENLIGMGDFAVNPYAARVLRDAMERAGEEVQDFLDAEASGEFSYVMESTYE